MREIGVAVGILVGMSGVAVAFYLPWTLSYTVGVWVTVLGAILGIPTGAIYHLQLYRILRARDQLPPGWYWQPISLNQRLTPWERPRVLPWCYVGGVGFMLMVLGLVILTLALVAAHLQLGLLQGR